MEFLVNEKQQCGWKRVQLQVSPCPVYTFPYTQFNGIVRIELEYHYTVLRNLQHN